MESSAGSYFWFVLSACVGGFIVLAGICMEVLADKDWFKNINALKFWKSIKFWGEIFVIVGIAIEVVVAGFAAKDEWQTRQMVINNSPLNQPISHVFVQVSLIQSGTNSINLDPLVAGACNLRISSASDTNFWMSGGTIWNLTCSNWRTVLLNGASNRWNKVWFLDFEEDMFFAIPRFKGSVRDSIKWDAAKLVTAFLPRDTTILGGTLKLTVNSTTRDFEIPSQKISNSTNLESFAKSPPKNVTVFTW